MPRPSRRPFRRSRKNRKGFRKGGLMKTIKFAMNHEVESKYIASNNEGSPSPISTTGFQLDLCNNVTRGVAYTEMIGNRLKLQALRLVLGISAADNTNIIRMVIGYAKNYLSSADFQAACSSVYEPWDQEYAPAYILMDKVFTLASSETSGAGAIPSFRMFKITRKLRHWPVAMKPSGGVGVVQTGHLFAWFLSDSGAAAHPALTYNFKTTFQDA